MTTDDLLPGDLVALRFPRPYDLDGCRLPPSTPVFRVAALDGDLVSAVPVTASRDAAPYALHAGWLELAA